MLTNANITRIDRVIGHTADGKPRMVEGAAISVRCALDAISTRQRHALGATLQDADQVVYIPGRALAITPGDLLRIQMDEDTGYHVARVVTLGDRLGPAAAGLSHLEIFVRKEPLG